MHDQQANKVGFRHYWREAKVKAAEDWYVRKKKKKVEITFQDLDVQVRVLQHWWNVSAVVTREPQRLGQNTAHFFKLLNYPRHSFAEHTLSALQLWPASHFYTHTHTPESCSAAQHKYSFSTAGHRGSAAEEFRNRCLAQENGVKNVCGNTLNLFLFHAVMLHVSLTVQTFHTLLLPSSVSLLSFSICRTDVLLTSFFNDNMA